MYITQIEVSDMRADSHQINTLGHVAFQTPTGQVQVDCAVRNSGNNCNNNSKLALITEALRQIARMPEYRAGRGSLSFAPGVWPLGVPANA
ncbi:hypothetical protein [Thalassovita taeanensis]|uniref:Uncharacterized protein n=1 Tax=Thalassovita taeanensis TaxID=657014 RepID=A0A1H9INE7_9RHOB|nr:hypothetical protein [Thalassovita taeanensis]SEQ76143.1 hypothetical protein SAMN04488092_112108 [Thalassovita taeanensis]